LRAIPANRARRDCPGRQGSRESSDRLDHLVVPVPSASPACKDRKDCPEPVDRSVRRETPDLPD